MWALLTWFAILASDECSRPTSVCISLSCGTVRPASQTARTEPISRETFLATEWGFGAEVISIAPPREGFPMTFREDGSIEPFNLSGITRWSLTDGILELSGRDSGAGPRPVPLRFEWRDPGVFWSCS